MLKTIMMLAFCPMLLAGGEAFWQRDPALARQELSEQWKLVSSPGDGIGIRGVLRYALEGAALQEDPQRLKAALVLARSMQDLDPASATYGNFRWRWNQDKVNDLNAVEFVMMQAGLLHLRWSAALDAEGLTLLEELMTTGLEGISRHRVGPDYTNIYLNQIWSLIAAGESLKRPDIADRGYQQLGEWMAFTARTGIPEYGAVVYYGIDMEVLALIAKFAGREEGRKQATSALRYLWTDVAANWWAAGDRYGSTNARTYDYLFGHGYLESQTWAAGWLRSPPDLEGAGWLRNPKPYQLTALYDSGAFPVPNELTEPIRKEIPRVVVQRWGVKPGQRAVHYIGANFSIASSGATRSREERSFIVNLGDSPQVPQMTLFMDGRDDPYGTKKMAQSQGATKALHLQPSIWAVQQGADVLQVLADEPANPKSKSNRQIKDVTCMLTQLTIPASAEVWLGETRAKPGTPDKPTPVPADKPLFVRVGAGAVGFRFLVATTTTGAPAAIGFIADKPGDPAWRVTIVHDRGVPTGRAVTAFWARGMDGVDEKRFATFRREFAAAAVTIDAKGDALTLEVPGKTAPLHLAVDTASGATKRCDGGEAQALLSVNGRDLGRDLMIPYGGKP